MRFDDRLKTLLDAPVADARDRAVRWRQLVDLLSRTGGDDNGEVAQKAIELVRVEAFAIDEQVRAATVRGIAGRSVGAPLLRILAAQPVRIAAPLFAGLTLTHDEAALILADADAGVRSLVSIASPPAAPGHSAPGHSAPESAAPRIAEPQAPSIGDMVDRIERLRHQRSFTAPPPPQERRVASAAHRVGGPRLFEWESDASGHIAWVEGAPRGALVGRPLGGGGAALLERQAASRIEQRHPFVDVPLAIGESLAGEWSATGVPAFDPGSGRFLGYRGLAKRLDGAVRVTSAPAPGKETDMDALREMVHEIKTPLNAIIGFAEIIDGQYLGPAHRRYRERAAQIVGQARLLLDAVEDLDFAARLRAERSKAGPGSRLADLFPPIAAELERCMQDSGGVLDVDLDDQRHRCALSPALAERLLRRLLLSLCQQVEPGEHFRVAVSRAGAWCVLMIARPRRLDGLGETQLVDPAFDPSDEADSNAIGLGFALRLVRGLSRVAGGDLLIDDHRITLHLPALD
ncbi:MAG: hypothetical protein M3Q57_00920 [Pseudomonadota bacterium]|nr:hypothetical protein [Pseudomonadota bacterium]